MTSATTVVIVLPIAIVAVAAGYGWGRARRPESTVREPVDVTATDDG